jgi:hypothetical protein
MSGAPSVEVLRTKYSLSISIRTRICNHCLLRVRIRPGRDQVFAMNIAICSFLHCRSGHQGRTTNRSLCWNKTLVPKKEASTKISQRSFDSRKTLPCHVEKAPDRTSRKRETSTSTGTLRSLLDKNSTQCHVFCGRGWSPCVNLVIHA